MTKLLLTKKTKRLSISDKKGNEMKLRRIDWIMIYCCAFAAALCYVGNSIAPVFFIASSSIGLVDSVKHKVLTCSIINVIFLTLNIATLVKTLTN